MLHTFRIDYKKGDGIDSAIITADDLKLALNIFGHQFPDHEITGIYRDGEFLDGGVERKTWLRKLFNMTDAGMIACTCAFDEANGDIDKALEILEKKGYSVKQPT